MQYVFGGPNWQINKQNMAPAYFVCVDCVRVSMGLTVSRKTAKKFSR